MKDLYLDSTGDVIISGNDLQYITSANLMAQKLRMILGTNKGEWKLNTDEGINFRTILTKNPDYDQILDTVLDGLHQVDEGLQITDYSFNLDKNRHLTMTFTAILSSGEAIDFTVGEMPTQDVDDSWLIRALADLVEVNC